MKHLIALIIALALCATTARAQTKAVLKTPSTNGLTENLVVPSGRTFTINSGGSIVNNGTATGFSATVADGDKGDITVSASGATWTVDSGVVNVTELGDFSLNAPLVDGDILRYDGSNWRNYVGTSIFQEANNTLAALATAGSATADTFPYYSASGFASLTAITAAARGLLDDANVSTMRGTLGIGSMGVQNSTSVSISGGSINGLSALGLTSGALTLSLYPDRIEFTNATYTHTLLPPAVDTGIREWSLPDASGTLLLTDGSGASLTSLNASALGSGTVPTARLGSGTANSTTYLRGDNTWQTITSGDTPGGSGTEIQYRAGAATLGAVTGSSVSGGAITLGSPLTAATGSVSAPGITLTGATADTGLYSSATDTLDFAIAGSRRAWVSTSEFKVSGINFVIGSGSSLTIDNLLTVNTANLRVASGVYLGISSASDNSALADAAIYRDAAATFAIKNPTTLTSATKLRIYETEGGSNDEYLEISASSGTNVIQPAATGTGTASKVDYYVTSAVMITSGTGSPESAVTAPVGALYLRTDGGSSTTLYVKESGTGNTGWIAK